MKRAVVDISKRDGAVDFDAFLLLIGKLNYSWTNTESLLIHLIAGLSDMDKEIATVVFLTLNTTRARIDMVERLSKLDRVDKVERERVLELTGRIQRQSALRNRYNHCIYAFDNEGENPRSILMRIADRKDKLMMGQVNDLDAAAAEAVKAAIAELRSINRDIWKTVSDFNYPD
ncbi:hypothetical protein SAMN05444287_2065 [Octadecabacter temperatus]|jgi:hypothetical protein|uniref:Uncharacterized protein n=1 Tax=Octadecabacter temperatus TaxID=1458307 RepID=A0A0K0Y7S9_9RHOB|nr:hypothetical protein [Octadecabacter temperatus]AKS46941.1 hypothetical protein OSB_24050 [Octadecabacter temperatus]SIO24008.1 hypothetical protein SAMN05444287_2065 [Octadecabacter temperatus]